jgi:uncharacterized phage-like protein YoqJ
MQDIYDIECEQTLCFTGHRPDKLFGYNYRTTGNRMILLKLRALIERFIVKKGVTTFISGMALGIDMWSAQIVLQLKEKYPHIKLVCAVPCANHSIKWNEEDQQIHKDILEQADLVHYVSTEPYTAWCMNKRNEMMVDSSNYVIAIWDGVENGGTWNTVKYAKKRQVSMIKMHPTTLEITT